MKNINELLKEYEKENDLLYRIEDYTHCESSYICDIINEIVDSDCPIYWSDLIKWFNEPGTEDYINEAVNEYRPDNFDIMKAMQWGWCKQAEEQLYKNIDAIGKIWLLAYLRDKENLQEITDEQADFIDDLEIDSGFRFADILDKWNEYNENED